MFEKLAIARSYHRPMSSARGTLIKLLVTCNSGVKVRNVAATVSADEHVVAERAVDQCRCRRCVKVVHVIKCTEGLEESECQSEQECEEDVGGCDDDLAANRLEMLWVARARLLMSR